MNLVEFLVLALATWRLSSLLVNEDGPAAIFERIRFAVGVAYDASSERYGRNEFAKVFICVWCASVWVAFATVGAWFIAPQSTFIFCLPFALSAVAVLIQGALDG